MLLGDIRATLRSIPANIFRAAALLITMFIVGTAGYIIVEGFPFLDAVYMRSSSSPP